MTRDRTGELARAVASARAQTFEGFELLIALNGASEAVRALARAAHDEDARIRVVELVETTASLARNVAASEAKGELVYFLDDDVVLPPELFALAVSRMREDGELGILGGPNLTAQDEPFFARLSGTLLASAFGSSIARARYAPSRGEGPATEAELILCNLVVRRNLLTSGLRFPGLFGGEENVLMGHATSRGVRMAYSPALFVYHKRRATLRAYVEQLARYGEGRANALRFAPHTFRFAYLVPSLFTLYLVVWPLLAFVTPLAHVPLALYALATLLASIALALRERAPSYLLPALLLYPITHVSYGVGLARRALALASLDVVTLVRRARTRSEKGHRP